MNRKPIVPEPVWPLPVIIVIAIWVGVCSYGGYVAEHFIQKFW